MFLSIFKQLPADELVNLLTSVGSKELFTRWRSINRETKIQAELILLSSQRADFVPYQQKLLQQFAANPSFSNQRTEQEKIVYLNTLKLCLRRNPYLSLIDRVHCLLLIQNLEGFRYHVNNSIFDQTLVRIEKKILTSDEITILVPQMTLEQKMRIGRALIQESEDLRWHNYPELDILIAWIPHSNESQRTTLIDVFLKKLEDDCVYIREGALSVLSALVPYCSEQQRIMLTDIFIQKLEDDFVHPCEAPLSTLSALVPYCSEQQRIMIIDIFIQKQEDDSVYVCRSALSGLSAVIPYCNEQQRIMLMNTFIEKLEDSLEDSKYYDKASEYWDDALEKAASVSAAALGGLSTLVPYCNEQQRTILIGIFIKELKAGCRSVREAALSGLVTLVPYCSGQQRITLINILIEKLKCEDWNTRRIALDGFTALVIQSNEEERMQLMSIFIECLGKENFSNCNLTTLVSMCSEKQRTQLMNALITQLDDRWWHCQPVLSELTALVPGCTEQQRIMLINIFLQHSKKGDERIRKAALPGLIALAPECSEEQSIMLLNELKNDLDNNQEAMSALCLIIFKILHSKKSELINHLVMLMAEIKTPSNLINALGIELIRTYLTQTLSSEHSAHINTFSL
ncbi:hypothetical protein [Legionella bozemanae]|nr:hypothetical protein [Legionella bozemanae]